MDFKKGLMIGFGIVAALIATCCAFGGCGLLFANKVGNEMVDRQKADIARTQAETARIKAENAQSNQMAHP